MTDTKQVTKLKKGLEKLLKTFNLQTKVVEEILNDLESDEEDNKDKEAGHRYGTSCFGYHAKKNDNIIDEY